MQKAWMTCLPVNYRMKESNHWNHICLVFDEKIHSRPWIVLFRWSSEYWNNTDGKTTTTKKEKQDKLREEEKKVANTCEGNYCWTTEGLTNDTASSWIVVTARRNATTKLSCNVKCNQDRITSLFIIEKNERTRNLWLT